MNDPMKTDYPSNQLSYHELIASKQKIVTLSISPNHLRKYPSSPVAATMDPDPASYPKPMEEIEKLIQRGDLFVYTTELKRIKNGLDIMHERHGEILKEKEDKIWAVQNHLLTERAETDRLRKEVNSVNATIGQQLNTIRELRQSNLGNYRQIAWLTTKRDTAEKRYSGLEKDIEELKQKGKRAASALISTAKELEEEKPLPKKRRLKNAPCS